MSSDARGTIRGGDFLRGIGAILNLNEGVLRKSDGTIPIVTMVNASVSDVEMGMQDNILTCGNAGLNKTISRYQELFKQFGPRKLLVHPVQEFKNHVDYMLMQGIIEETE